MPCRPMSGDRFVALGRRPVVGRREAGALHSDALDDLPKPQTLLPYRPPAAVNQMLNLSNGLREPQAPHLGRPIWRTWARNWPVRKTT